MDLNKVQLIGRLTRDPEIRQTPQGTKVASFSVATGYSYKDNAGQKVEQTEFHNVIAWSKLADIVGQYLKKGSQVYIEGRLVTRSWEKDGKKNYRTEVVTESMIMLGGKTAQPQQQAAQEEAPEMVDVEDIPF